MRWCDAAINGNRILKRYLIFLLKYISTFVPWLPPISEKGDTEENRNSENEDVCCPESTVPPVIYSSYLAVFCSNYPPVVEANGNGQ